MKFKKVISAEAIEKLQDIDTYQEKIKSECKLEIEQSTNKVEQLKKQAEAEIQQYKDSLTATLQEHAKSQVFELFDHINNNLCSTIQNILEQAGICNLSREQIRNLVNNKLNQMNPYLAREIEIMANEEMIDYLKANLHSHLTVKYTIARDIENDACQIMAQGVLFHINKQTVIEFVAQICT